jgi:hypothetical protein
MDGLSPICSDHISDNDKFWDDDCLSVHQKVGERPSFVFCLPCAAMNFKRLSKYEDATARTVFSYKLSAASPPLETAYCDE